ncbi:choline/ethanolamine transporter flvcr2a isoform X2 [Leptinotarsa decemlineata]|uniref:choline/ethanolamine transporter flvcr2a isoform X2 n=1 Tax=Leptinotarsa decemlineata TaxID=7539 RepID=UPI003D30A0F0
MEAYGMIDEKIQPVIEVCRKRWVILIIYILCTCLSTAQWIEYSIITNIVMKYYHVSASTVDWTSTTYGVIWPIVVFPASYIIDKMISTVCSLGILGMTLGTAMSYLVPPIMVRDSDNMDEVAADLKVMCWGLFLLSTPLVLIVFFYFPEQPLNPPSMAMFEERNNRNDVTVSVFVKSLKDLMKNEAFHVHNIAFGLNVAIYCVIGTFLNQLVLSYFPGAQEDAGRMGSLMIIAGIGGSVSTGIMLDKTHRFKETSFITFVLGTFGLGGVLYALTAQNKWLSYLAITMFGIFLSAYLPAGVEFATEITYPSPEGTVLGILYATSQVFTVILTIMFGVVLAKFGTFWVLIGMMITMALGSILTVMTPNKLKRQEFFKINNGVTFTQLPQVDNSHWG